MAAMQIINEHHRAHNTLYSRIQDRIIIIITTITTIIITMKTTEDIINVYQTIIKIKMVEEILIKHPMCKLHKNQCVQILMHLACHWHQWWTINRINSITVNCSIMKIFIADSQRQTLMAVAHLVFHKYHWLLSKEIKLTFLYI